MAQINSIHLQNALDFITKLDNRDYTGLAATMAPDCTHRFLPATLGGLGKPVRGKEELLEFAKDLESIFETINVLGVCHLGEFSALSLMLVVRVSTVSAAFRDRGNKRCRDPSRMWLTMLSTRTLTH
jgi:hypothetical protein